MVRIMSELDAGSAFLTAAPDWPFQAIGMRDPKTRELCLHNVMYVPVNTDPNTALRELIELTRLRFPQVEIVTGEEAEAFLRTVADEYRELTN
jgi:hypothetical protein